MIPVAVTIRAHDRRIKPHQVAGYAADAASPLAAVPWHDHDSHTGWIKTDGWCITHRPTGFCLGNVEFATLMEALETMQRCNPAFPAWLMATGTFGDTATLACKAMFRMATGFREGE
jgi:hypothetical protein